MYFYKINFKLIKMLIRNIKCSVCGANKVNEISTAYIYCDYCGALMGYDIETLQEEAKEIFAPQNISNPAQQKFIKLSQELGLIIKNKNKEKFIDLQLQILESEFNLYKKRFSPKIKQASYRQKYLDYYKKYWTERIDNGYFEKNEEAQQGLKQFSDKIKTEYIDGKNITTFNEDFIGFLDKIKEFINDSVDETLKMDAMQYHPEGVFGNTKDILYRQGLSTMIQQFDEETITKSLEHLDIKTEFITIDDVPKTEIECSVCSSKLNIPEGSESIVCETCGTFIEIKSNTIKCFGCGASFNPKETDVCPFCNTKLQTIGVHKSQNQINIQEQSKSQNPPKKKGFFGKLFG